MTLKFDGWPWKTIGHLKFKDCPWVQEIQNFSTHKSVRSWSQFSVNLALNTQCCVWNVIDYPCHIFLIPALKFPHNTSTQQTSSNSVRLFVNWDRSSRYFCLTCCLDSSKNLMTTGLDTYQLKVVVLQDPRQMGKEGSDSSTPRGFQGWNCQALARTPVKEHLLITMLLYFQLFVTWAVFQAHPSISI